MTDERVGKAGDVGQSPLGKERAPYGGVAQPARPVRGFL